jgi:outer membrane lipoprotein LolB
MRQLQAAQSWDLEGRAAAAVGTQGWQAHLSWQQQPQDAQVRLAGPLGVGAIALTLGPAGVKMRDPSPAAAASATPDAVPFLEQRLGFSPPFAQLRFWLLGVPSPDLPFEWQGNDLGRAQSIVQDGWRVEYPDYMRVGKDVLPRRMTLTHESVRVRVAVDRWTLGR